VTKNPIVWVYGLAAVALLAVGVVVYRKGPQALKAVGTAVNPLSDQNVAYKAANAVTQAVTGKPDQTLGGAIYDFFNGDKYADQLARERQNGPRVSATYPDEQLRGTRKDMMSTGWDYDESERLLKRFPPES
jgi:hypothetical protein